MIPVHVQFSFLTAAQPRPQADNAGSLIPCARSALSHCFGAKQAPDSLLLYEEAEACPRREFAAEKVEAGGQARRVNSGAATGAHRAALQVGDGPVRRIGGAGQGEGTADG